MFEELSEELWTDRSTPKQANAIYNLKRQITASLEEIRSAMNGKLLKGFADYSDWTALEVRLTSIQGEMTSFLDRSNVPGRSVVSVEQPGKHDVIQQQVDSWNGSPQSRAHTFEMSLISNRGYQTLAEGEDVSKKQLQDTVNSLKEVRRILEPICQHSQGSMSNTYASAPIKAWYLHLRQDHVVGLLDHDSIM